MTTGTVTLPKPRYLGDGIVASHDGEKFVLVRNPGQRVEQRIALDAEVLTAFGKYQRAVKQHYKEQATDDSPIS